MHKANVVGTAVGRYLIRSTDPYPKRGDERPAVRPPMTTTVKQARTLENSEVREYSWPCVLVFVSQWEDDEDFGVRRRLPSTDYIPKTIYLEDGRSVPI